MVHGELGRRESPSAVMAGAFGTFPLPPLGISEVPGFATLARDVRFGQVVGKWFHDKRNRVTQLSISL